MSAVSHKAEANDENLTSRPPRLVWHRGFWLALGIVTVVHLISLMRTPAPFVDEAWYASRAQGFLNTGYGVGALDLGVVEQYPGYEGVYWILGPMLQALVVQVSGISLFGLRVESLAFGLLLLGLVYSISSRLSNSRAALLAVLIGAFSVPFTVSAHLARHDIMVAALGYGAIALCLNDEVRGIPVRALLAGGLIGLGLDIHPNIIIYVPTIWALYLLEHRTHIWRSARFWSFNATLGVGILLQIVVHVLPSWPAYLQVHHMLSGDAHKLPILAPQHSVWYIMGTILLVGVLSWPLLMFSLFERLVQRAVDIRYIKLLVIFWVTTLTFTWIIVNRPGHYSILLAPGFWLIAGDFVDRIAHMPWRGSRLALIRTVIVLSLLLTPAAVALRSMVTDSSAEFESRAAFVRETIPPDGRVMGVQTWWLALHDRHYISWEQLVFYRRWAGTSDVSRAFDYLQPEYLILDETTEQYLVDNIDTFEPNIASSLVQRGDFEQLIQERGILIGEYTKEGSTPVRVYRLSYSPPVR